MISPQFLLGLRKQNNWSQSDLAGILGVSRPTYISIEKGETSPTLDQLSRLAAKLGCDPQDLLTENITDEKKYKEVVLEAIRCGADPDGRIAKTKLAKLIYLADFGWYYHHLESMTGAKYRKLQLGPVPNIYFSTIDELFMEGLINIQINNGAQMIELTRAGKMESNLDLSVEEKNIIKEIGDKWQGKRSEEIVKFTHEQLPYKICTPGEIIPYELITQQDPDYVY